MSQAKKPNTFLITSSLAAGTLAYVFLVFLPGQEAIGRMRRDWQHKQDCIVDADRQAAALNATEDSLRRLAHFEKQWISAAPTEASLPAVFAAISGHGRRAGVSILRFEPQTAVRLETVSQIPLAITAEGEFPQLFEFLRGLDESASPIWTRDLLMQAPREPGKPMRCQLTLTIFADNSDKSDQTDSDDYR